MSPAHVSKPSVAVRAVAPRSTDARCVACDGDSVDAQCPICRCDETAFLVSKNQCDIYSCAGCRSYFVWPTPDRLDELYDEGYFAGACGGFGYADYEADKIAAAPTYLTYLRLINRAYGRRGRLLDVGAATGFFVELAQRAGWFSMGLDISPYAVARAEERGLDVRLGALDDDCLAGEQVDVVTLWDVLEHTNDPRRMLRGASRALSDGGLLAINTPDGSSVAARMLGARWAMLFPPEHLTVLNRESLGFLLDEFGFEVLLTRRFGKSFTPAYVASNLYGRTKKRFLLDLSQSLRSSLLNRIRLPIHFRDNIFVLARKRGAA